MKRSIVVLLPLLFLGCVSTPVVKQNVDSHLRATLSPDGAVFETNLDAKLKCRIYNASDSPVEVDTFPLGSSTLSVDVYDSHGKRIPSVPPPMPPPPDEAPQYLKVLRPGRSINESYSLYMFSPPLKPGVYTARMRNLESNEVKFTIKRSMGD